MTTLALVEDTSCKQFLMVSPTDWCPKFTYLCVCLFDRDNFIYRPWDEDRDIKKQTKKQTMKKCTQNMCATTKYYLVSF